MLESSAKRRFCISIVLANDKAEVIGPEIGLAEELDWEPVEEVVEIAMMRVSCCKEANTLQSIICADMCIDEEALVDARSWQSDEGVFVKLAGCNTQTGSGGLFEVHRTDRDGAVLSDDHHVVMGHDFPRRVLGEGFGRNHHCSIARTHDIETTDAIFAAIFASTEDVKRGRVFIGIGAASAGNATHAIGDGDVEIRINVFVSLIACDASQREHFGDGLFQSLGEEGGIYAGIG